MNFKLGEFFCGPGGLALGALSAQVKNNGRTYSVSHGWSNDYDRDTCDTYTKNVCPEQPESVYCQDVRKLSLAKLGSIDAFAFGFPCNDFSIVGEQKGSMGYLAPYTPME